MHESLSSKESQSDLELLNPAELYTTETRIYAEELTTPINTEPILFGKDIKGHKYFSDGCHRTYKAWQAGKRLWGRQISKINSDITQDPDFHLVPELIVVPKPQ